MLNVLTLNVPNTLLKTNKQKAKKHVYIFKSHQNDLEFGCPHFNLFEQLIPLGF